MTDTLRDLLHESVADAEMSDVSDVAWVRGARARRRRAGSAMAGLAAVVLVVGGVVWVVDQGDSRRATQPVQSPSPTVTTSPYTGKDKPDAEYLGTSVWWAPSVAQETSLAYTASPLPTTIDLSAPVTPLVSDPIRRALAAFTLVGDSDPSVVLVLGVDGSLRAISLAPDDGSPVPVSPMRDPEGNLRIRAGTSMLSPSGEYLMFPQDGSIRLLRLRDSNWSTIDTGSHATWDATWTPDDEIVLWNRERPDMSPPVYDVTGQPAARAGATDDLNPRWDSDPFGLPRRSPGGSLAQSYTAGTDVPQPPSLHLSPRQSDWIGVASAPDAILVLPQEPGRQKQCCQVAGWIDRDVLLYESRSSDGLRLLAWQQGTRNFWQVSDVVGWTMGKESVVSSYARLPIPEAVALS
jgi:hypothetical protein